MITKKFKSSDGTEKYISLTSGHTFRINKNWQSIPDWAWMDCYAAGCISEDMINNLASDDINPEVLSKLQTTAQRKDDIKRAIIRWYNENQLDKFDVRGAPKVRELTEEVGFRVGKNERDEVWYKLQEELK